MNLSLVGLVTFLVAMMTTTTTTTTEALASHGISQPPKQQYGGGGGVGRFVLEDETALHWKTHYDMILVERLQTRKTPSAMGEGDLYVPDADLPRLHLCRVLSVGAGREEENGSIAPDINGVEVGDLIIAKDPWGIGPKDEELADGTKLSYMRGLNIAAKLTGDLVVAAVAVAVAEE